MASVVGSSGKVVFGLFEADLRTGELWKAGHRIRLQSQPFKVLSALLENPGEVVSREELQIRVWGRGSVGDFDHSLGTAINKIREALSDTADNPRFIETLARRGYRFIAPVTVLDSTFPAPADAPLSRAAIPEVQGVHTGFPAPDGLLPGAGSSSNPPELETGAHPSRAPGWALGRKSAALLVLLGSTLGVLAATWYFLGRSPTAPLLHIERLTHSNRIAPGAQAMEGLPASVTDGLRIFTPVIIHGRPVMAQVDVHTGSIEQMKMPSEISSPTLGNLSPDGANLLLRNHLSPESEQAIWVVPTAGGSALRLANVLAHDATWMPDGKGVLYAAGNELVEYRLQDGSAKPFAKLPGRAFWLRWSPDGAVLRFTLLDPIGHTLRLWQISQSGREAKPILGGWAQTSSVCCGTWTGDGKYYVFQSTEADSGDLWRLEGKRTTNAVRVTNGPLSFVDPITQAIGHRIYFLGLESQSALLHFDRSRRAFVAEQAFLAAANRIEYSRDLLWVVWTDQQGRLWRARADGSELIQVTPNSLQVFLARWSPDGKRLALMAREAGSAWHLYTVAPDGGTPTPLLSETRNAADPSWSPDGQQIVFGRVTDFMGKEDGTRALQMLDLRTGKVSTVPGSDHLFSPRWSPDGRYIAAISLDQRTLMLLDLKTGTWLPLADTSVADPVWSPDSKSIFYHASQAEMEPIYRVSVADGHLEQIANLANFVGGETADYFFYGLTPDNDPIVRSRTRTGDIYSIDLDGK